MIADDIRFYHNCGFSTLCFGKFLGSRVKDVPDDYLLYLLNGSGKPITGKLFIYASFKFNRERTKFKVSCSVFRDDLEVLAYSKQDVVRIVKRDYVVPSDCKLVITKLK